MVNPQKFFFYILLVIMKILAFADTHGYLPEIDHQTLSQVDCIMVAGDVCPMGHRYLWQQELWLAEHFCNWVRDLKKPVFFTLGNHDFAYPFEGEANLVYGIEYVYADVMMFSWTPVFKNWAWMCDEKTIAAKLQELLSEDHMPAIWLTHGPPYGICDEAHGRHLGSRALREAIETHQPRLVICGHVHEGAGHGRLGRTFICNVALFHAENVWNGKPVTIVI